MPAARTDAAARALLAPTTSSGPCPATNTIAGRYEGADAVIGLLRPPARPRRADVPPASRARSCTGDGDHVRRAHRRHARLIDGAEHRWSTVGLYRFRGERSCAACWLLAARPGGRSTWISAAPSGLDPLPSAPCANIRSCAGTSQQIEQDDAGPPPGPRAHSGGPPLRRAGGAGHALLRGPHQVGAEPHPGRTPACRSTGRSTRTEAARHACSYCFARPTHEYLDLNAGRGLRAGDRRQGQRAGGAAGRAGAAVVDGGARWRSGRTRTRTSGSRGATSSCAAIWEALRDVAQPVLHPHEVAAAAARPRPAEARSPRWRRSARACRCRRWTRRRGGRRSRTRRTRGRGWRRWRSSTARASRPGILIAPLMPGINDAPEQVARIVELATRPGRRRSAATRCSCAASVREVFFDWLREHRPDLVERYEKLYARGAYLQLADRRKIERGAGAPWAGWSLRASARATAARRAAGRRRTTRRGADGARRRRRRRRRGRRPRRSACSEPAVIGESVSSGAARDWQSKPPSSETGASGLRHDASLHPTHVAPRARNLTLQTAQRARRAKWELAAIVPLLGLTLFAYVERERIFGLGRAGPRRGRRS